MVEIIYKNRRSGKDRRKAITPNFAPERRSGLDRRKLDEKLKHLIKHNIKDEKPEKKKPVQPRSGEVILRKKAEEE